MRFVFNVIGPVGQRKKHIYRLINMEKSSRPTVGLNVTQTLELRASGITIQVYATLSCVDIIFFITHSYPSKIVQTVYEVWIGYTD